MNLQQTARTWRDWLLILIAVITILSGLAQIILPENALSLTGISTTAETVYLFRLVSLLTALFGGMLLHTVLSGQNSSIPLLWAGLQKVISTVALILAVISGLLPANNALLVAAYDFVAGLFVLWCWRLRG